MLRSYGTRGTVRPDALPAPDAWTVVTHFPSRLIEQRDQRNDELAVARAEVQALSALVREARNELEHERATNRDLLAAAARVTAKLSRLRDDAECARAEAERARAEAVDAGAEADAAFVELVEAYAALSAAEARLAELEGTGSKRRRS